MGFPSICYGVIMPKPLVELADLWIHIKLMVRLAFFYLGLFDPTDVSENWEEHGVRRSTLDTQASSLLITSQEMKKRLPIVKFADFVRWSGGAGECDEEGPLCAVCLNTVEERHQIRELGNCSHVFHIGCLDKWVDLGQVTCPLCRSMLLPRENQKKGTGDSWIVDRISYLFGEDLVRY